MKKIIIILLTAIVVITSLNGVASTTNISVENRDNQIKNVLNDNQTHGVLAEYATTTACPYCPTASGQLYSIYNSDDYDFDFVTIVVDKITELPLIAQGHLADRYRELGVHSVPDVYFDGGYKNILGKQSDEQPYRTSIEQSGTRSVPQVEIDLNAEWKSSNILKITAEVQSNDPEFDGKIRIYITEISSRWNDQQGKPYHYTVLDILVDKSLKAVSLDKSNAQQTNTLNTITVTKWWYGDITKDNCMLIAAVFDKDTDYAIQTASTKPDDKSNNDLSTKSYTKLLVVNGFIGKIYPIFEEINEWEDAGISTQRPYSLSLAPNNILQKLLEIFPNSFTLLRYLYGL